MMTLPADGAAFLPCDPFDDNETSSVIQLK
jgi:hypothetical protein